MHPMKHWTTVFENNFQYFIDKGWMRRHDLRVMRGGLDKIHAFICMQSSPVQKSTIQGGLSALKESILHHLKKRNAAAPSPAPEPVPIPEQTPEPTPTPSQKPVAPSTSAVLEPITQSLHNTFQRLIALVAEKDEQLRLKDVKIDELETQLIDAMGRSNTEQNIQSMMTDALKTVERLSIDMKKTVSDLESQNERTAG